MAVLRVPFKMLLEPVPHFSLGAKNTVLLLVDAQHFTTTRSQGLGRLASDRGIDRELDEYYRQTEAALQNMATLIAACRARDVPIMHTVLNCSRPDRSDLSRQMRVSGLPVPTGDAALKYIYQWPIVSSTPFSRLRHQSRLASIPYWPNSGYP